MTQSSKIPYTKPHYTYAQQLDALVKKGMVINMTESQALHYLSHCNYYRLSGYWYDYKVNNTEAFKTNTRFSEIIQLYQFDKALRILLLDAIEQIEVSVRTKMAYHLGEVYGAYALLKEAVFHQGAYQKTLAKLKKDTLDSNEVFIQHFLAKYQEPLPPIWAVVELMSMGQLSHCYKNLKKRHDAKVIADNFDLDSKTLQSFLHHLTTLRNHCAHHARVWNRRFTITIQRPRYKPEDILQAWQSDNIACKKLYNTLIMMVWVLNIIDPEHTWTHRLKLLLNEYNLIDSIQRAWALLKIGNSRVFGKH
jgi:abortive infection bacteriophage resistance protein